MGIFKYIALATGVYSAVVAIMTMVHAPALMSAAGVWMVVQPVLAEIQDVANVRINMGLALQIVTDATNTVKVALTKGAATNAGPLQASLSQ